MMEFLLNLDESIFLFLNGLHAPWLDPLMAKMTRLVIWSPLFIAVIGWIIIKFKWHSIPVLIFIAISITITDQVSSAILKPWVGRIRPSHEPHLVELIHLVNGYKGGIFSFVSSHAANSFGVATFLWLIFRKEIRWIWIMIVWAMIFSYTRIYLGVHYPFDILGGAILGVITGYVLYILSKKLPEKFSPIPSFRRQINNSGSAY